MKRWLAWVLMGMLLAACFSGSPTATLPPPATLQPLVVYHPPALRWMAEAMARCTQSLPELALYRFEASLPAAIQPGTIWLGWGEPPEGGAAYQVGEDTLLVITHPSRTRESLTLKQIDGLFNGRVTEWEDGVSAQVWIYPPDDPLWQVFASTLDLAERSPDALIAPDPLAMLQAVSADTSAIGLLPQRWLDERVHAVALNEKSASSLRQPITVTLSEPPEGLVRAWLICLQSSLQP